MNPDIDFKSLLNGGESMENFKLHLEHRLSICKLTDFASNTGINETGFKMIVIGILAVIPGIIIDSEAIAIKLIEDSEKPGRVDLFLRSSLVPNKSILIELKYQQIGYVESKTKTRSSYVKGDVGQSVQQHADWFHSLSDVNKKALTIQYIDTSGSFEKRMIRFYPKVQFLKDGNFIRPTIEQFILNAKCQIEEYKYVTIDSDIRITPDVKITIIGIGRSIFYEHITLDNVIDNTLITVFNSTLVVSDNDINSSNSVEIISDIIVK